MTEHNHPHPGAVILDLDQIQDRHAIGKTKALELVHSGAFPHSVVPGMHRYPLAALEAWELATALTGTVAAPAPPSGVMARRQPIKLDAELGVRLYGPTASNPKYRLDYVDPIDGGRRQPTRHLQEEAYALWDETLTYLRTVRHAAPLPGAGGV